VNGGGKGGGNTKQFFQDHKKELSWIEGGSGRAERKGRKYSEKSGERPQGEMVLKHAYGIAIQTGGGLKKFTKDLG